MWTAIVVDKSAEEMHMPQFENKFPSGIGFIDGHIEAELFRDHPKV